MTVKVVTDSVADLPLYPAARSHHSLAIPGRPIWNSHVYRDETGWRTRSEVALVHPSWNTDDGRRESADLLLQPRYSSIQPFLPPHTATHHTPWKGTEDSQNHEWETEWMQEYRDEGLSEMPIRQPSHSQYHAHLRNNEWAPRAGRGNPE